MKTKEKNKRVRGRGAAFILRYLLSLIFGWGFVISLIVMMSFVVVGIITDGENSLGYPGESFALMLTALVLLGVAHLALTFSVDGVKLNEKTEKYVKVLGTIYNIGLAGMATGFAVVTLFPLFGLLTGLTSMECKEVAQLVTIGGIAVVVLMAMMFYRAWLVRKISRWVYPVVMGLIAVVTIVLFLAIPARYAREAIADQKIVDDLELIYQGVYKYVGDNYALPSDLQVLNLEGLNRGIDKYEFAPGGEDWDWNGYYSNLENFTLCTDGFMMDRSSLGYQDGNFGNHTAGRNCFELSAFINYIAE